MVLWTLNKQNKKSSTQTKQIQIHYVHTYLHTQNNILYVQQISTISRVYTIYAYTLLYMDYGHDKALGKYVVQNATTTYLGQKTG